MQGYAEPLKTFPTDGLLLKVRLSHGRRKATLPEALIGVAPPT